MNKNKQLPLSIFSKKHLRINNLIVNVLCILFFFFNIFWSWYLNLNLLVGFILSSVIGFLVLGLLVSKINPVNKLIKKVQTDVKVNDFYNSIEEFKNNNLNHDTLSYLNIIQCDYLVLVDKKKYIESFNMIEEPNFKEYWILYKVLEFMYYLNIHDLNTAKRLFEDIKVDKKFRHIPLNKLELSLNMEEENYVNDNIENELNINSQYKYNNLVNVYNLMVYFMKRNDLLKTKKYAQIIIDEGSELKEAYSLALEIVKKP